MDSLNLKVGFFFPSFALIKELFIFDISRKSLVVRVFLFLFDVCKHHMLSSTHELGLFKDEEGIFVIFIVLAHRLIKSIHLFHWLKGVFRGQSPSHDLKHLLLVSHFGVCKTALKLMYLWVEITERNGG